MNTRILLSDILTRVVRTPSRTLVMTLGVLVSVCATILLQAIGAGFKDSFLSFVESNYPPYAVHVMGFGSRTLTLADMSTVLNGVDNVTLANPAVYLYSKTVTSVGNAIQVSVEGHSEKAREVMRRDAAEGSFFDAADIRRKAHVALLGPETAQSLFPNASAVGKTIFIDNMSFQVKGVLAPRGPDPHGMSRNRFVYVPYTVAMDQIAKIDFISAATFVLQDGADMTRASEQATRILRAQHNLKEGEQNDFGVSSPLAVKKQVGRISLVIDTFVSLLAAVAYGLSALVIWIIMHLSLKQRTAEVGLRKSLGARPGELRIQFVLEIMAVMVIGCLVGWLAAAVLLNTFVPALLEEYGVDNLAPDVVTIVVSVVLAIAAGVLGGWLPIRKAAGLHPILALR